MWKRGYQGVNVAGHCMQLPVVLDKLGLPLFEFLEQAYVSNIVCANKHEDRLFRSSRVFNYVLENRVLKFVTPLNFLRHKFELHLRFFAFRKKPLLYAFAEKVDPEGIDWAFEKLDVEVVKLLQVTCVTEHLSSEFLNFDISIPVVVELFKSFQWCFNRLNVFSKAHEPVGPE